MISFANPNAALKRIFVDDEPIFTVYFPASAIHEVLCVSKDARSAGFNVKMIVCDFPSCNKFVFANAFNSSAGLSNFCVGAVKYNCTTSLPATFPLLVTVTVAVIFLLKEVELNFKLL